VVCSEVIFTFIIIIVIITIVDSSVREVEEEKNVPNCFIVGAAANITLGLAMRNTDGLLDADGLWEVLVAGWQNCTVVFVQQHACIQISWYTV
jgi:hypothetical protein